MDQTPQVQFLREVILRKGHIPPRSHAFTSRSDLLSQGPLFKTETMISLDHPIDVPFPEQANLPPGRGPGLWFSQDSFFP
jgi:hypothetical protein